MYKTTTLNQLVLEVPPASRNWAGTGTLEDVRCKGPLEFGAPSIPSHPPLGGHPFLSLPGWLTLQTQLMSLLPFLLQEACDSSRPHFSLSWVRSSIWWRLRKTHQAAQVQIPARPLAAEGLQARSFSSPTSYLSFAGPLLNDKPTHFVPRMCSQPYLFSLSFERLDQMQKLLGCP